MPPNPAGSAGFMLLSAEQLEFLLTPQAWGQDFRSDRDTDSPHFDGWPRRLHMHQLAELSPQLTGTFLVPFYLTRTLYSISVFRFHCHQVGTLTFMVVISFPT